MPLEAPQIGDIAPSFAMLSTKDLDSLNELVSLEDYLGKYLVLFFYPLDFTFVCPTELVSLSRRIDEIRALDAEVLGVSVDSVHVHRAWMQAPKEIGGIGPLAFPLGSDLTHEVSQSYGVYNDSLGHASRATFVIDRSGIVRAIIQHDLSVGRSTDELLRVLAALQSGGLCPVDWKPGDKTLGRT